MAKQINISIHEACSEKWESFEKTAKGGFCSRCSKNVVDFTKMSDSQIAQYFSKKPIGVCGKFYPGQLKTYQPLSENRGFSKAAFLAAGLLAVSAATPALAEGTHPSSPTEINIAASKQTQNNTTLKTFIIIGHITHEADSLTNLAGSTITILQTGKEYTANIDGRFEINYEGNDQDSITLLIAYPGSKILEQKIIFRSVLTDLGEIRLAFGIMEPTETLMGGVSIDDHYKYKPTGFWQKIKSIFK
jgi:hypothetical protein